MGAAVWASCWVLIQEGAAADVHAETKLGFYTVVVMGMEGAAALVLLAVAVFQCLFSGLALPWLSHPVCAQPERQQAWLCSWAPYCLVTGPT